MTSYKKVAQEAEERLVLAMEEIAALKAHVAELQENLIQGAQESLSTEEARELLTLFGTRAKSRDELLKLIRTLAKL